MKYEREIPILPGSALTDVRLQQAVQYRIAQLESGSDVRDSLGASRYDLERIRRVLAHFPWREYSYKFGRWQQVARWWWDQYELFARKWAENYRSFQLLDPQTGEMFGTMTPPQPRLLERSGRLLFAGDPMVGGVYSPGGDGMQELHFVWRSGVHLGPARKLMKSVGFGRGAAGLGSAVSGLCSGWAPWMVDYPDKPAKFRPDR